MPDKDKTEEIREQAIWADRVAPLRIANNDIMIQRRRGTYGAWALYQKRALLRIPLKNNDIWDEFIDKWEKKIEENGRVRLPEWRLLRHDTELFDNLDDLMDSYMDKVGMSGYKESDKNLNVDFAVSGDVFESEDQ